MGWGDSTNRSQKILDESWLNQRLELFENVCFPSVINQSNINFKWLVFFDINTPEGLKKKVFKLSNEFSCFTPLFVKDSSEFYQRLQPYIQNEVRDEVSHIITTRLDNDDALEETYIETIQDNFLECDCMFFNCSKGVQLNFYKGYAYINKYNYPFSPFSSLIEKAENFKTIAARKHTDWVDMQKIIEIRKPMWVQVIHEKNMVNDFNGYIISFNLQLLKRFNIKIQKEKPNLAVKLIIILITVHKIILNDPLPKNRTLSIRFSSRDDRIT